MKIHESITEDRVLDAVRSEMSGLENPSFCLACGEDASECEPDAERYPCEACGVRAVYGAEQVMIMM